MDHVEPILLSAYLDDEVSADEREHVERHIAGCDACRGELQGLRTTAALLRLLPEAPLPRTFYVTEAMVEPAPRVKESWWQRLMPRLAPLGAVAAMLLVVVLGAQFLTGGGAMPAAAPAAEPEIAASMPTEGAEMKGPEGAAGTGLADETGPAETNEDARVMEEPAAEEEIGAQSVPGPTEEPVSEPALEEEEPTEAPASDAVLVDPEPGRVEPPLVSGRGQGAGGGVNAQPGGGGEEVAAASGPSPLLNVALGLLVLALLLLGLRAILYRRAP